MHASIRTRLILHFILLTLVPMALVGTLVAWDGYHDIQKSALESRRHEAMGLAAQTRVKLLEAGQDLIRVGDASGIAGLDFFGRTRVLASLAGFDADLWLELVYLNDAGLVRARVSPDPLDDTGGPVDEEDLARAYQLVAGTGAVYYGAVRFLPGQGPVMLVASPMLRPLAAEAGRHRAPTGELSGVLVGQMRLAGLDEMIRRGLHPGEQALILDGQGRVVAGGQPGSQWPQLAGSQAPQVLTDPSGQRFFAAQEPFRVGDQTFSALSMTPVGPAADAARRSVLYLLGLTVLFLALAAWLAHLFGRSMLKPLAELGSAVAAVERGELHTRAPDSSIPEYAMLSRAFNIMTARLDETMRGLEEQVRQGQGLAQTLLESEAVTRTLLDAFHDAAFLVDAQTVILACNEVGARRLNTVPSRLVGQRLMDVFPPKLLRSHAHRIQDALRGQTVVFQTERQGRHLETVIVPVGGGTLDDPHKVTTLGVFARDITEVHRAQEALRQSEVRFRTVALFTHDWEYWIDPDGQFNYISPSCERITGYPPEAFMRDPGLLARIVHPDDRQVFRRHSQSEQAGGSDQSLDFRIVTAGGEVRWIGHLCRQVFDVHGADLGRRVSNRDVTEYKRLEERLRRATQEAEDASRAKSDFLANMSHEIRTPLSGILGMTDLVMTQHLPQGAGSHLRLIQQSARSLLHLINDILDFSKIEARKLELSPDDFDLFGLLDRMRDTFALAAKAKGLDLELQADLELPRWVHGDPDRLAQVLTNLIGNALKFTERGGVELRALPASAELGELPAPTEDGFAVGGEQDETLYLVFEVCDSGIGIAPEKIAELFDPFRQLDSSYSKRHGGTGLGLAISRELVQLMGGELRVESTPGLGSCFRFRLPFAPAYTQPAAAGVTAADSAAAAELAGAGSAVAEPAEGATSQPTAMPPAARPLRILLAEDNRVNREFISFFLEEAGYEVECALDGRQVLEMLVGRRFDVVLMDVQMPELDGVEATRAIRRGEAGPDGVPIVALTAYAMKGDRERFLDAGMDDYLAKPVDFMALHEILERLVREGRVAA